MNSFRFTKIRAVELGMFRGPRYGWSDEYMEEYLKEMQPSEPKEDFDDRNAMYAM
jgi:protein-ribulosamine 3-kinase